MRNRKNKIWVVVLISVLTLTTGCAITTTRNYYGTFPDQSVKEPNKNEAQINYPVDTLTNIKNE